MGTKQTVFVGLSGGVDSSVAAARLKKAGYDVVGVFIRVWHPDFIECTEEADRLDAMRVAAHLEIPFLTCDAREAYKHGVADTMIEEYARGRTPNPDVLCNKVVKFGVFDEFRRRHGAAFIATGHYARRTGTGSDVHLRTGIDPDKDQTYFLWMIERTILNEVMFPIGDTVKARIRSEARQYGLPTAQKRDSQGICFLGKLDMTSFLSHYITTEPGPVYDTSGTEIGIHPGALFFTLGQRHGFTIRAESDLTVPRYVVAKDLSRNALIVDTSRPVQQEGDSFALRNENFLADIDQTRVYDVVTRYHGPRTRARIHMTNGMWVISLGGSTEAVSYGQSAVLYDGDICIGGGIIEPHEHDTRH